jgi:hypothetical protein
VLPEQAIPAAGQVETTSCSCSRLQAASKPIEPFIVELQSCRMVLPQELKRSVIMHSKNNSQVNKIEDVDIGTESQLAAEWCWCHRLWPTAMHDAWP